MEQLTIDYDRASQLARIDRAALPACRVTDGSREVSVSPMLMKAVLRSIDSFGRGRECWPSVKTLAAECNCHERSVRRAIRGLVSLSLLIVQRKSRGSRWRVNHYRIVWSELALLDRDAASDQTCHTQQQEKVDDMNKKATTNTTLFDLEAGKTNTKERQDAETGTAAVGKDRHPVDAPQVVPSQPPADVRRVNSIRRLSGCGVATATQCIDNALRDGATCDQIDELITYYQDNPGKWGPGALVARIHNACVFESAEEGWPVPHVTPTKHRDPVVAWEMLRATIWRAGKRAGVDLESIERRCEIVFDEFCAKLDEDDRMRVQAAEMVR